MTEEWKVVKDTRRKSINKKNNFKDKFIGHLFEVSNRGRARKDGKIIELELKPNVYPGFCGKRIHRWVAELFIPNSDNKPCVDHIDTNPHNNSAENLRWVTYKENCNNSLTREHMKNAQLNYYKEHPERKTEISKQHKNKSFTSVKTRQKMSINFTGKGNPAFGHIWMSNGTDRIYPLKTEANKYLSLGYHFGKK